MISRLTAALRRRCARFAAARAGRRLAAAFRRAGADLAGSCLADGPLAPLVASAGTIRLADRTAWRGRTQRTEIHVAAGATLAIGARTYVNQGCTITAARSVEIGADCLLGEHVALHDTSFHPVSPDRPTRTAAVRLGRNVWLGHRVTVLPGVEIGDHTVVAAGAVVTRSLPPRAIAAGVPARVIATFDCPDDWRRH